MVQRRYLVYLLLPLAMLVMNGCPFITSGGGDHPPPPPPTGYKDPTSISNVLDNLTKSYTEMNYSEYVKLFHPSYQYIFAPQDVGGPNNNPASWGLSEELVSAGHLFSKSDANTDGYVAESATLTYVRGQEIPNDMETWTKVVLSNIFLTLKTRKQDTGDPLDYLVEGDQAYLWFIKEGANWSIVRWEDKPIAKAKSLIAKK